MPGYAKNIIEDFFYKLTEDDEKKLQFEIRKDKTLPHF